MKRSPSELRRTPLPQPSVIRIPLGHIVVGWNCMNSMSFSGSPARSAIDMPSPVCRRRRSWSRGRATDAAGREQDGLAANRREPAVEQIPRDHALAAALVLDQLPGEELLVDGDVALDQLLVEHLDQDVAGDVGREDGPRRAHGAERALRQLAVLVPREDGAPVLELVDVARRLAREDLDRVLVAEVVGALDGVERVDLGVVVARVAERRVDPASAAPEWLRSVQLGDDGDVRTRVEPRSRRACPRSPAR